MNVAGTNPTSRKDECLVSVVIPCFNQARYLPATIESALNQTTKPVEVIVVDDGSSDETGSAAERFGGRIKFFRQANAGPSAARNHGLRHATGTFVHFLDADDLLLPDAFESHLSVTEKDGADVTVGGWQEIDADGSPGQRFAAPEWVPDAFHTLLPFNLAPPVCYLQRRCAVEAIGGFDESLRAHEDWDLVLRLAAAGYRFGRTSAQTAKYRVHAGSSSQQRRRMYDTSMAVLAKARAYHPPCLICGDRFSRGVELAREDYYHRVLGQAMRGKQRPAEAVGSFAHFVSRSIRDPSLAWQVLKLAGRSLRGKL